MKKFKALVILLILFFGLVMVSQNVFAADTTKSIGAKLNRPFTNQRYFYYDGETNSKRYTLLKIYDSSETGSNQFKSSIYCLRGNVGFGTGTTELNNNSYSPITYTKVGDMKENAKEVISKYNSLYGANLGNASVAYGGKTGTVNLYNAILWIMDNAYLPKDINASEYKAKLLKNAGELPDVLSDDDIEAIQQLAIWFFVNNDSKIIKNTNSSAIGNLSFGTGTDLNGYVSFTNTLLDVKKRESAEKLYNYFVSGAIENASKYGTGDSRKLADDDIKIEFNKDLKAERQIVKLGKSEHLAFGPFEIKGNKVDSLDVKFKINGTELDEKTNPLIMITDSLDATDKFVTILEDVVGKGEFYINIPNTLLNNVNKVELSLSYENNKTTETIWEAGSNNQAVVIIDREKITYEDKIESEEPKVFDLALRKFISKVDGVSLTENSSREPKIQITSLVNGRKNESGKLEYTATYTHSKTPIEIKTGSKVVYTIRVYNEGQIVGTATQITDYLPEGLKFIETTESTINKNYKWVVSGDGKTVTTDYLKDTTIKAFNSELTESTAGANWQQAQDKSGLYYADVQIECEVIANVSKDDKTLRNIAAVTGYSCSDDRDSNVNIDINNYNPSSDNSTYQQDDDDYEPLILKGKKLDLALRKYIVSINGKALSGEASRVPQISTAQLKDGSSTTALYKHEKEPVEVKAGDLVTYRIETYNEGEIDGYVYSIKDYIPEYLEFVSISGNEYKTENANNILTITKKSNQELVGIINYLFELNAYNGGDTLDSKYVEVTFKVKENFVPQADTYLTNVATMTYGSKYATTADETIPDRDSNRAGTDKLGEEFNVPSQEQLVSTNKVAYKGDSSNKSDLEDSTYFYKGQQDDDDFEKLLVKGKHFDLSLRKFISKVERDGQNITIADRTPKIEIAKLKNGTSTTATYKHSKDIITLKRGDIVTYTIRVYNEGDIDGYATKVADYLPVGLELVEGKNAGWTLDTNTNTLYTESLASVKIPSYNKELTTGINWQKATDDQSGLFYADLQVVCKVKDTVTDGEEIKNVAEIYQDAPDTINDRDSVPGNVYEDKKHNPGSEVNGYTPGEQDDDDFERVTVISDKRVFDLALRKYIVSVNDKELKDGASRVPNVDIAPLKQLELTATYKHKKDPVEVTLGSKVKYNLAIYNEGEKAGRATKVIDQLPEGLKFVKVVSGNFDGQYDETTNKLTLTRKSSNKDNLPAFDGDKLSSEIIQIECEVAATVSTEDKVLTNVAWIMEEYDAESDIVITNQPKLDRDSEPETKPNVNKDNMESYKGNSSNKTDLRDNSYFYKGEQDDDDFEKLIIKGKIFDLALRKYIVKVGSKVLTENDSRVPVIDLSTLESGTTATYKHKKDAIEVTTGTLVTYNLTVYNEGDRAGRATKIVDQLPEGLKFEKVVSGNFKVETYNEETNTLTLVRNDDNKDNLNAFDGENLASETIQIECKVTAEVGTSDKVLTNVAWIKEEYDAEANVVITNQEKADRDSNPDTKPNVTKNNMENYKGNSSNKADLGDSSYFYKGEQDDDDFEKLIVKGLRFDLALRKFITKIVRNGNEVEFDDRTPKIDITTLINGTYSRNGKTEKTATYEHAKDPLLVKKGDVVTYTLRIYNEGELDGTALEVTDYIPEGLALILEDKVNVENGWIIPEDLSETQKIDLIGKNGFYKSEDQATSLDLKDMSGIIDLSEVHLIKGKVTIKTEILKDENIKAFDKTLTEETAGNGWQKAGKGEGGLYYKDVELKCLVIAENYCKDTITNIAEITEDTSNDEDSIPNNVVTVNEDDDDFEPIELKYFDLALRKFITGVGTDEKITEVTSRIPVPKVQEDGKIKYEHTKTPVDVVTGNTVVYTLRVYNEGTIAGYADEIADDIPDGLKFLPNNSINKKYEWVMLDKNGKVTDDVSKAVEIRTDYLSSKKEVKKGFTVTDNDTGETTKATEIRENILVAYDESKGITDANPAYKDVKVAFEVIEPTTSNRTLINSAQITKDSGDDEDSIPDKWNEGEDDQDKEYVHVKYFDLSLLKWVTKSIVTVDSKTTTTQTGFKPNQGKTETTGIRKNSEAEPIAKVEVDKKKIDKTTVKFTYKIRVTNEGDIAGYATEITDYIPTGLVFYPTDETNQKYGWTKANDSKITTKALEKTLLKPGEFTELEITFRWKNDANNMGIKTNVAEISSDYNEFGAKDIDSITNNRKTPYDKEQEDDDDFALVMLSTSTGSKASYIVVILIALTIVATGVYSIKKYVLI